MLMHKTKVPDKTQHSSVLNNSSAKLFVPLSDINTSKQEETECLIMEETRIDSNGIVPAVPSVQIEEPTKPEVKFKYSS